MPNLPLLYNRSYTTESVQSKLSADGHKPYLCRNNCIRLNIVPLLEKLSERAHIILTYKIIPRLS